MTVTLADLDEMLVQAPGFRIVGELKIEESGVDPIGLRQLNLDLMDLTVPGINNVTTHIRPYGFMAWAWSKALHVATESGGTPETAADLAARYETIYAWAHSLANAPLRGAAVIKARLPMKGDDEPFLFEGAKWEEFKVKRTSLMAPTEYGPSIKAIHYLNPEPDGTFRWPQQAEKVIATIDSIVCSCIPTQLLVAKAPSATWREVEVLAHQLPIDTPSDAEREAFRFLFYDAGDDARAHDDMRRRRATIDLLRSILPKGDYLPISDIRRRLSARANSEGIGTSRLEVQESALLLSILQARQLQRLAIEAMLLWVERSLGTSVAAAKPTDQLVAAAHASAMTDKLVGSAEKVGEYMKEIESLGTAAGWPGSAALPGTDVVELMELLHEAQRKDVTRLPALALKSIAIVYAMTKVFRGERLSAGIRDPIEARPDRLPMGAMAKRIELLWEKPLSHLWRDIIESWIIGQHVHWSAVRGSDGKKRLRIGLEGSGWIRVRPKPSTFFRATPDRLATLLSLGSECGLFSRSPDKAMHFGQPA